MLFLGVGSDEECMPGPQRAPLTAGWPQGKLGKAEAFVSHTGLSANPESAPTAMWARKVTYLLLASVALVCPVEIPSAPSDVVWRKWQVLGPW